ncbi:MAG: hypothetical protein M0Z95_09035, partial [Actinomycetota bacterium]|nr:hypothetical protein [Actinomycetota bacterium]
MRNLLELRELPTGGRRPVLERPEPGEEMPGMGRAVGTSRMPEREAVERRQVPGREAVEQERPAVRQVPGREAVEQERPAVR